MIFPIPVMEPLVTITPFSLESLGSLPYNANTTNLNSATSGAWSLANRAIFIPFFVSKPIVVVKLFFFNGATVSGNIDAGIYTEDGTKIVSIGSTAQAGINSLQSLDITDTELAPGVYYMACAMDNTTGTIFRVLLATNPQMQTVGMAQMASAFPLPASATFASIGVSALPVMGLTTRVVI